MSVIQDIRYGARLLWRSPGFTTVSVGSLALGLASAVALFAFMNALLFRPLPGRQTADIHRIYTSNGEGGRYGSSSFQDFLSFTSVPGLFAGACATTNVRGNLTAGGHTQALAGAVMNGGCFDALRLRPHLGRLLGPIDDAATGEPAAIVISHSVWRRSFGGDPAIVGRAATLNGASVVIAGVAEEGFAGLSLDGGAAFWAPPPLAPMLLSGALAARGDRRFSVYVRLAPGVTGPQAADRLKAIAAALRDEDPRAWTETSGATRTVTITRELASRFAQGQGAADIAALSLGAIAGIIAIACVNLATMFMARGAARTRELNIRLALGASPARLLRQLGTESLLVSVGAAAAGVLLVATALKLFEAYRPTELPAFNLALDWRVASVALLMALVAPVAFGVAPGAHALRLAIADGLRGEPFLVRRRFLFIGPRELLLVAQVAVSFALVITAALFVRSLAPAEPARQDPAVRLVSVVPIDLSTAARSDAEMRGISERLRDAADRVPGIDGSSFAAIVPMTGSFLTTSGRAEERPQDAPIDLDCNIVDPGYFELMGVGRRAGRAFDARDDEGAPRVAVVSESLARRLWSSTAVVGRAIRLDKGPAEIVGVVADVPYRSFASEPQPVLYVPLAQSPRNELVLHARVRSGADGLTALDRALRTVDARVIIGAGMPLSEFLDQSRAPVRASQRVGAIAGVLQLGLALMATWALVAYAVERRTKEIAIRRALGASEASILRLVMRPSMRLLAVGGAVGLVAGIFVARALHAEVGGLAPIDLTDVLPAAAFLALVVMAAAWMPVRRTASIEPASALKQS